MNSKNIPLSLYIHLPWCVQKCPYCDFISFADKHFPEEKYIDCLIRDLHYFLPFVFDRPLVSIFFGGGTPSLFSPASFDKLLNEIQKNIPLSRDIEISMEANPGTFDETKIKAFKSAGINRLSIGVQSFQDEPLKKLGRIHDSSIAKKAIGMAKSADFRSINIDLMFGLPNQNINDALFDLNAALNFETQHLSWYQLTIEQETPFAQQKLTLPSDDFIFDIEREGHRLLKQNNFHRYETSAFVNQSNATDFRCQHNLNYWEFGDYIGLGLAAHGKLTDFNQQKINRFCFGCDLNSYLEFSAPEKKIIKKNEIPLEFMMNALRLTDGFSMGLFPERTGLPLDTIKDSLHNAIKIGYLEITPENKITPTERGKTFLNRFLIDCFLQR